jgi:arginine-tRNA-protein transferase
MILDADFEFINEEFSAPRASPTQMDKLWADGWRHFGTEFFRYNVGFYNTDIRLVIPLRIRLKDFSLSKSQRRVLRRNQDLTTAVGPVAITSESEALFDRHKARFDHGVPRTIYDFVSREPATVPCETIELAVYRNEDLVAVSYLDLGKTATSGVYAMFEPSEGGRSLGIFTMLKEIEYAIDAGKTFYYQGYSYEGNSYYDYKKRFRATECFDWKGNWERSESRL